MILEDLLLTANCTVFIMNNISPVMSFNCETNLPEDYFSKEILNKEVKEIDIYDNRIIVWLRNKGELI